MILSKRINLGAPKAASESQLIEALVFLLLVLDVLPDGGFIVSRRRNPVAARTEMLPHEAPVLPDAGPRYVNGTLALQIPNHLRDRLLWQDRHQPVHT